MTDLMNELINDEAVYRTAPATPGMLKVQPCSSNTDNDIRKVFGKKKREKKHPGGDWNSECVKKVKKIYIFFKPQVLNRVPESLTQIFPLLDELDEWIKYCKIFPVWNSSSNHLIRKNKWDQGTCQSKKNLWNIFFLDVMYQRINF